MEVLHGDLSPLILQEGQAKDHTGMEMGGGGGMSDAANDEAYLGRIHSKRLAQNSETDLLILVVVRVSQTQHKT
jgi:hypothetical protein